MVHWKDGKATPYAHPCNPLKSTELSRAKAEAWNVVDPYGTHLTSGIAICREVIDLENRLYIFECPSVSVAPKVHYEEPKRQSQTPKG